MKNMTGVYKIINKINGKCYYGSAQKSFGSRWNNHISQLELNKHWNKYLQAAWNKYGAEAFDFIIEEVCAPVQCIIREQSYLDKYWDNCKSCYNISPTAGSPFGIKHTDETREKMSKARKGRKVKSSPRPNRQKKINPGDIFFNFKVINEVNKKHHRIFNCECLLCGNNKNISMPHLITGFVKSCGCFKKQISSQIGKANKKHGHCINGANTPEYQAWNVIINKYYKENVDVCETWLNDFTNFLTDVGKRPNDNYCLIRINNNMPYTLDNVKWATFKEAKNNTKNNVFLTYNNETHTIAEWANITGMKAYLFYNRLKNGWNIEDIFTTPVNKKLARSKKKNEMV